MKVEIIDNTMEVERACQAAVERALTAIGLEAENDIKKKITEPKMHKWGDKLHPKMRGSVDHGHLRNSITNQVVPQEECVYVGTNIQYAQFVEYGTSKAPAYPFIKPAIEENSGKYKEMAKHYLEGGL